MVWNQVCTASMSTNTVTYQMGVRLLGVTSTLTGEHTAVPLTLSDMSEIWVISRPEPMAELNSIS